MTKKKFPRDTDASYNQSRQMLLNKVLQDLREISVSSQTTSGRSRAAVELEKHIDSFSPLWVSEGSLTIDIEKSKANIANNVKLCKELLSQVTQSRKFITATAGDANKGLSPDVTLSIQMSLKKLCIKIEYACKQLGSFLEKIMLPKERKHDHMVMELQSLRDQLAVEMDAIEQHKMKSFKSRGYDVI